MDFNVVELIIGFHKSLRSVFSFFNVDDRMSVSYCCCDAMFGFLRAPNTYDRSARPVRNVNFIFLSFWLVGGEVLTRSPVTDTIVTVQVYNNKLWILIIQKIKSYLSYIRRRSVLGENICWNVSPIRLVSSDKLYIAYILFAVGVWIEHCRPTLLRIVVKFLFTLRLFSIWFNKIIMCIYLPYCSGPLNLPDSSNKILYLL